MDNKFCHYNLKFDNNHIIYHYLELDNNFCRYNLKFDSYQKNCHIVSNIIKYKLKFYITFIFYNVQIFFQFFNKSKILNFKKKEIII